MKKSIIYIFLLANICVFSQTTTSYDINSNFLLNKKPFFPFGCYGLYYTESQENKINSVRELSKAGFNIMCLANADNSNGQTNFLNLLDTAFKYKVYFVMGASNNSFLKYRASQCLAKPALFGYTLADDADDNTKTSLEECRTVEAEIKAIDKNRLTHLTLTGWDATRRAAANDYIAISDFCSYQCYPIGNHRYADITPAKALTLAYERTLAYVKEAELQKKPFVHTPQTFTWAEQSDIPRYPTVIELRNMTYSALAAGVKGFISYDFSFDLINNQKPLWKEYADLAKDVKSVQSILFENKLTRHNTADNELVFSSWRKGDTTLFVIVNTSYTFKKNINQKIDWSIGNQLIPVSNRLESPLYIENGTLTGSISPQGVQVYTTVAKPTSLEFEYMANVITINPNPAKNELLLNGSLTPSTTYEITSIEGKGMQSGIVNSGSISIENLKAGIYFIKIGTKGDEKVLRFVKE